MPQANLPNDGVVVRDGTSRLDSSLQPHMNSPFLAATEWNSVPPVVAIISEQNRVPREVVLALGQEAYVSNSAKSPANQSSAFKIFSGRV